MTLEIGRRRLETLPLLMKDLVDVQITRANVNKVVLSLAVVSENFSVFVAGSPMTVCPDLQGRSNILQAPSSEFDRKFHPFFRRYLAKQ